MKMNGMNVTAGRCRYCPSSSGPKGTVYYWPSSAARLSDMRCPVHGTRLNQTSLGQWTGRTVELSRDEVKKYALPSPDTAAEIASIRRILGTVGVVLPGKGGRLPAPTSADQVAVTIGRRGYKGVRVLHVLRPVPSYDGELVFRSGKGDDDLVQVIENALRYYGWNTHVSNWKSVDLIEVRPTDLNLG